jgi:hypothetical protein
MQENNRTELERFDRERKADLLNMMKGFVLNQVNLIVLFCPYRMYELSGNILPP